MKRPTQALASVVLRFCHFLQSLPLLSSMSVNRLLLDSLRSMRAGELKIELDLLLVPRAWGI